MFFGGIYLLELQKFTEERIQTEAQHWLKFFKDGARLDADALPDWLMDKSGHSLFTTDPFGTNGKTGRSKKTQQGKPN